MISDANLDFWIKNNYNVIFRGKHGVGKTATILDAFKRHSLKWQYFSASTMDPWVDFIGVPKEKIDEHGNSYLDLVRPKHFQNDQVEAIFLDEFNRSSKKVRNAVMELIQFKSINGKRFNNLKIVWAAINPEDDEGEKYDVEALDPAQLDRFHVIVDVPYAVHVPYFRNKYGQQNADVAVTWWKELTKDQQSNVSPRRLDYAMDMYTKGGDLKFVLPTNVNVGKLIIELANGSISKKLEALFEEKKKDEAKTFLAIENNFAACSSYICKNKQYHPFFLPLIPEEKLVGLMSKDKGVQKFVFGNYTDFESIINNLATAKSSNLSKQALKTLKQRKINVKRLPASAFTGTGVTLTQAQINKSAPIDWSPASELDFASKYVYEAANRPLHYSGNRLDVYHFYDRCLPKNLDETIATQAVQDLTIIAINSQKNWTIDRKMKNLTGLLNHACKWFIDNGKQIPMSPINFKTISAKLDNFIA